MSYPEFNTYDKRQLLPHHVEFINAFLKPDTAPYQRLVSPVGTGRTYMVRYLVQEILRRRGPSRILILAPKSLSYQWADQLTFDGSIPVQIVDTYALRSMQADRISTKDYWPDSIVAVVSVDWAKQETASEALSTTEWDLVVVDEAQSLRGSRKQIIRRLVSEKRAKRLLLLTSLINVEIQELPIPDIVTVRWSAPLQDWEGHLVWQPKERVTEVVSYRRSPEEIDFLAALQKLTQDAQQVGLSSIYLFPAIRLASSSLYAIGQYLRRQRNRIAHKGDLFVGEFYEEVGDEYTESESKKPIGIENSALREKLLAEYRNLIQLYERIQVDAKLQICKQFLMVLLHTGQEKRLLLFTSFIETADYLESSLNNTGIRCYKVTGSSSNTQSVVREFQINGGVVITTDVQLGIDWGGVRYGINYDLSPNLVTMEQRWSHISRPSVEETSVMVAFRDQSGVLENEEALLQKIGFSY